MGIVLETIFITLVETLGHLLLSKYLLIGKHLKLLMIHIGRLGDQIIRNSLLLNCNLLTRHLKLLPLDNYSFSRSLDHVLFLRLSPSWAGRYFLLFYFLFLLTGQTQCFLWFHLTLANGNILKSLISYIHHRRNIRAAKFSHLFIVLCLSVSVRSFWRKFLILLLKHFRWV